MHGLISLTLLFMTIHWILPHSGVGALSLKSAAVCNDDTFLYIVGQKIEVYNTSASGRTLIDQATAPFGTDRLLCTTSGVFYRGFTTQNPIHDVFYFAPDPLKPVQDQWTCTMP